MTLAFLRTFETVLEKSWRMCHSLSCRGLRMLISLKGAGWMFAFRTSSSAGPPPLPPPSLHSARLTRVMRSRCYKSFIESFIPEECGNDTFDACMLYLRDDHDDDDNEEYTLESGGSTWLSHMENKYKEAYRVFPAGIILSWRKLLHMTKLEQFEMLSDDAALVLVNLVSDANVLDESKKQTLTAQAIQKHRQFNGVYKHFHLGSLIKVRAKWPLTS